MKVILITTSTYFILITWLNLSDAAAIMDYHYKMRRPHPPPPPRAPPLPAYIKKWQQQRPTRGSMHPPRPIPLQIMPTFIQPPIVNIPVKRPQPSSAPPPPVRIYWNTSTKMPNPPKPEKPFQSSPPVSNNINEQDYHIQTNSIPTNTITIKQVGEKGPIHTIPAPNLSLADKPIMVDEMRPQQSLQVHKELYQVTEPTNNFYKTGPQQLHFPQNQVANLQQAINNSPLSTKEIYEILNTHLLQQQNTQQNQNYYYQDMLQQDQNIQPFVYNYQTQSQNNEYPTAFISADYNIKAGTSQEVPLDGSIETGSDENVVFGEKAIEDESRQPNSDTSFYTTLPNQKVAQTLASLQAAGHINNNINRLSQQNRNDEREPLEIYVPDIDPTQNDYVRDNQSSSKNQIVFKDDAIDASAYNGLQHLNDQFGTKVRHQI